MRTTPGQHAFLQFNFAPYPLWRRAMPRPLNAALRALMRRTHPLEHDGRAPSTASEQAAFLRRWGLLPHMGGHDSASAARLLREPVALAVSPAPAPSGTLDALRLPAQWEPTARVMLAWPVMYPALWETHAQMVEAISAVAGVDVLVPQQGWAALAQAFLAGRGRATLDAVRFVLLPTNDIWVRDYGPVVGEQPDGARAVLSLIYDPLPNYPQQHDNSAPARYAALNGLPHTHLPLHAEGGNLWSDGAGTLIMTDQFARQNPALGQAGVQAALRRVLAFDKAVVLPRLRWEETGHVDLLVKLADARTMLVSSPAGATFTADRVRVAAAQLVAETNAAGERYQLQWLPTPPLYLNWLGWTVRRSYTNALTVNGRVLVPVYGVATDAEALDVYRRAMPTHEIVPIDCTRAADGGGAVHCLTKEVPGTPFSV